MNNLSLTNQFATCSGKTRDAGRLVSIFFKHRKRVDADILERVNFDQTFMVRIITGDETWVYEYSMQRSEQSSKWCHTNELKSKNPPSKSLKIQNFGHSFFFDICGVVNSNSLPVGQTVNKQYYLTI